ncbi:hypothetical protein [Subtercola sp. YIM 133946]|uniref:hypothetical protein n=1 Tax=Subtercola sp. YIM 133946 TaxID=3118909 RepID=UPI002F9330F8
MTSADQPLPARGRRRASVAGDSGGTSTGDSAGTSTSTGTENTEENPDERADRLKERVYVTFTALAVLIALATEAEEPGPAALVLLVTTAGVLLAGFAADIISHIASHARLPSARELRHMLTVTLSAFTAIALPMLFLGLAAIHVMRLEAAIRTGQIVLAISLGVFALAALRHIRLSLWRRLLLAGMLSAVGAAAILLEYLAHTL